MSSPFIRAAEVSETDSIVGLMSLAFAKDPVWRWVYPDPTDYLSHLPELARAFIEPAIESGTGYLSGELEGGALWFPVGVEADSERLGRHLASSIPEARHGEVFAFMGQAPSFHPEEPHWYLPMTGVDPTAQGRGHGSALLRHALEACDEQGLVAHLESSSPANLPLYERHGFEVVGEIQVPGSPVMFPMRRAARAG